VAPGPEGARSAQGGLINQSSDMTVRPAVQADARSIAEVHVETWRVAYRGQVPADYLESLSVDQRESMWRAMLAETGTLTFVLEHDAHRHRRDGDVGRPSAVPTIPITPGRSSLRTTSMWGTAPPRPRDRRP
jgi:hypothetical protein